jgi:hypothetical protein
LNIFQKWKDLVLDDDNLSDLQPFLCENPDYGDIIPGSTSADTGPVLGKSAVKKGDSDDITAKTFNAFC